MRELGREVQKAGAGIAIVLLLIELLKWGGGKIWRSIQEANWNSGLAVALPHTVAEVDAIKLVMDEEQGQLSFRLQCTKPSENRKVIITLDREDIATYQVNAVVRGTGKVQFTFPIRCSSTGSPTGVAALPFFKLASVKPGNRLLIALEVQTIEGYSLVGVVQQEVNYTMGTDRKLHKGAFSKGCVDSTECG